MEASRPPLPAREEYGALEGAEAGAPLAWDTVSGWLESARYYWLCTARADGRPHAVAVWGVWMREQLYFTMSPTTVTARILSENPRALVHLESASDVAIVEGTAERLAPEQVPDDVVESYAAKYDWRIESDDEGMPYFEIRLSLALAWTLPDIRETARRWRFD